MQASDSRHQEKRFARSLSSVRRISEFLEKYFADQRVDRKHLEAVTLATEELFTNMLKYGGGSGEIVIAIRRTRHELAVSLTDRDVDEFDVTQIPDILVDRPLSERNPGGLGIHLVKKLMDRVEYEYVERRGTTTLYKTLNG